MKTNWIDIKIPPKISQEYLVVWNLNDGEHPVVTTMNYDVKNDVWYKLEIDSDEKSDLLYYAEPPAPPIIPKVLWEDIIHETRNIVYGQCRHGENLASCYECNGIK